MVNGLAPLPTHPARRLGLWSNTCRQQIRLPASAILQLPSPRLRCPRATAQTNNPTSKPSQDTRAVPGSPAAISLAASGSDVASAAPSSSIQGRGPDPQQPDAAPAADTADRLTEERNSRAFFGMPAVPQVCSYLSPMTTPPRVPIGLNL